MNNSFTENGYLLLEEMTRAVVYCSVLRELIAKGADLEICNGKGQTPLCIAAASDNSDAVKILVNAGAKLDHVDNDHATALNLASAIHYYESADILIAAGADPNIADRQGYTPLMWAAFFNDEQAVKDLLKAGADPTPLNCHGMDAASQAMGSKAPEIQKLILDAHPVYQKQQQDIKNQEIAKTFTAPEKPVVIKKTTLLQKKKQQPKF